MSESIECSELVAQACLGNRKSMGELANLVQKRIYPYLYQATFDHNTSDDLLQETLLEIIRGIHYLRHSNSFWAWVSRIAKSKLQDSYRKQQRQTARLSACRSSFNRRKENSTCVLRHVIHMEKIGCIYKMLNRLKKRDKEIVQLRCLENMPYSKIADRFSYTPQQARIRFYRTKQLLKNLLADKG
ncbi:MAG: RNA polymerase sigma factor [Planctomycetota bacterium]|jgi:RNA polymerase sigma-70 factor (ECF subfamily)